jgi:ATP-dependent HslUV protease ATP-binding subunit HslU
VQEAAESAAVERLLDALTGKEASEATRESFRRMGREGHLDEREVEIEVSTRPGQNFELPGMPGGVGMINIGEMLGKAMGGAPKKRRKLKVKDALAKLIEEESDKRLDMDDVNRVALKDARRTASSSSTRSTRSRSATCAADRVPAKACSATCCR